MRFILEFIPLVAFFIVYKTNGILPATGILMALTIPALIILYIIEKKVAVLPLISAIILGIMGGMTLFSESDIFIKIKPTIVNLIFAIVLFSGFIKGKGLLRYVLGEVIKMPDEAWLKLSVRWAWFFVLLAILNEIIWRSFSTDFWVEFKVFGMLPLTLLFTITQIPFIHKNSIEIKNNSKA